MRDMLGYSLKHRYLAFSVFGLFFAAVTSANQAQSVFKPNLPSYKKQTRVAGQSPKFNAKWAASVDTGLFSPVEDLSYVPEDVFTTLEHPAFPKHSVRIKKSPSGFCDDSVRCVTLAPI